MQELIKLNYDIKEFAGIINEETFNVHHGKHLQAYVNNYNAAVEGTKYENMDLVDVLKTMNDNTEANKAAINNNGGGVLNHNMYFEQFKKGTQVTNEKFIAAIEEAFGSFDKMVEELTKVGMTRFGSGWSWLVVNNGKLEIMSTANQDSPYSLGMTPILTLDVWEHAYYLDYQNRRAEYLEKIWEIINWELIEERFLNA